MRNPRATINIYKAQRRHTVWEGCRQIESGNELSYIIKEIWTVIGEHPEKEFVVQWIPGHCGVIGNEEADAQANIGRYDENPRNIPITPSDAYCAYLTVKNQIIADWQMHYDTVSRNVGNHHWEIINKVALKPWFYQKSLNGLEIKIITRLRTGHGLCGVKKHLFKLKPTYFCMECEEVDDLSHIVLRCKKFKCVRDKYDFHKNCDNLIDLMKNAEDKKLTDITKFYIEAKLDF